MKKRHTKWKKDIEYINARFKWPHSTDIKLLCQTAIRSSRSLLWTSVLLQQCRPGTSSLWTSTSPRLPSTDLAQCLLFSLVAWETASFGFSPLSHGCSWQLPESFWSFLSLTFLLSFGQWKREGHPLLWPGPGAQVIQWSCLFRLPPPSC